MDIDISQITQSVNTETVSSPVKTTVDKGAPANKVPNTVKDDYSYQSTQLEYSRRGSGYRSMRTRGRSIQNSQSSKPRIEISRPRNYENNSSIGRLKDIVKQIQRKYDLPKSNTIAKNLNPATQSKIASYGRQAIADTELVNPQKFLESLEKMLPIALSTVNKGETAFPADFSRMFAQLANDLLLLVNQMMLSPNMSEDLKVQLQALMQLLGSGGASAQTLVQQISQLIAGQPIADNGQAVVNSKGSGELIEQLVSLKLLPEKYLGAETIPLKTLEGAVAKLQERVQNSLQQAFALLNSGSSAKLEGREMLITQLSTFQVMNQGINLNGADQARLMQETVGNQLLFATGAIKGMLGVKTQELAAKMTELIAQLAGQLGLPGNHPAMNRTGSESLLKLFSSILFGGAMMGRLIADRGDGKPWAMDEASAGMLQAQSAKELKIFDLVPFSLFAFFTPLKRDKSREQEKKEQQADQLLKKLIRLIMKLAFMLTSIYTGGKKIGPGGIDSMLKLHLDQLDEVIKDLLRTLMRIGDSGKVDVKASMIYLRRSRQALIEKDNAVFWKCIFSFFTDKNDLNAFLSEVEELDSTYSSMRTLFIEN